MDWFQTGSVLNLIGNCKLSAFTLTMATTLIKPIKNSKHYKHMMAQIKLLLDSPTDSPEADFLEILSILADDYENKITPILPPDPIDAIP